METLMIGSTEFEIKFATKLLELNRVLLEQYDNELYSNRIEELKEVLQVFL